MIGMWFSAIANGATPKDVRAYVALGRLPPRLENNSASPIMRPSHEARWLGRLCRDSGVLIDGQGSL